MSESESGPFLEVSMEAVRAALSSLWSGPPPVPEEGLLIKQMRDVNGAIWESERILRHFARLPKMRDVFLETLGNAADGITEGQMGEICKQFDWAVDRWFTALETMVLPDPGRNRIEGG